MYKDTWYMLYFFLLMATWSKKIEITKPDYPKGDSSSNISIVLLYFWY